MVAKIKILYLDNEKGYFSSIREQFLFNNIEIQLKTHKTFKMSDIKDDMVFLIISSANFKDIEHIILKSKQYDLFRPIIVYGDEEKKYDIIEMGVHLYYTQPVDTTQLIIQSLNLITLYRLNKDSKRQSSVLDSLTRALTIRDPYTQGHGDRVAIFSTLLYDALGYSSYEEREELRVGCIIHDVGKIGTPDDILKSDKRLSGEEFDIIKKHPVDGVEIVKHIISNKTIVDIVRHHHEKLDGSGYPDGLEEKDLNHLVRISTISDVYDALTSNRLYRTKNTPEQALFILEKYFVEENKIDGHFFFKFKELVENGSFKHLKNILNGGGDI